MRKTTRLELVILSYLLTFSLSNRLVARVFGNPTKSIVTLDATNENHLIQNVIPIAFDLNKTPITKIFTLTDAPVASDVNYCKDQTPVALTATGTDLKWYLSEFGSDQITSAPIPTTTSAGTTAYWVSQTINGIESPRAKLTVTVTPKSIGGSVSGSISVCNGNNSGTLNLTGNLGEIKEWRSSTNGTS